MIEKEELDRFIASCKDEQAELLMTLGRISAPSHHEEKRAAFCKKWFEHEGCNEVWIDEAQNVICKFNCDRYDEITVMMAHMDVVFNDTEELPSSRTTAKKEQSCGWSALLLCRMGSPVMQVILRGWLHHFPRAASGILRQHGSGSDAAHPGIVPAFCAGMPYKHARRQCHFPAYCPILSA